MGNSTSNESSPNISFPDVPSRESIGYKNLVEKLRELKLQSDYFLVENEQND